MYNIYDTTLPAIQKEFLVDISLDGGSVYVDNCSNGVNGKLPICSNFQVGYDDYPMCGRTLCKQGAAKKLCLAFDLGGNACNDGDNNFTSSCKGLWYYDNDKIPLLDSVDVMQQLYLVDKYSDSVLPYYNQYTGGCFHLGAYYHFIEHGKISGYYTGGGDCEVRCALRKNAYFYFLSTGGGGSAGAYVEDIEIPDEIIKKCINDGIDCEISFDIGKGGVYSNKVTSKDLTIPIFAKNGGSTSVEIKNGVKSLWKYTVKGGNGGQSALYQTAGIGGAALDLSTSCEECIGLTCVNVMCAKTSESGEDGVAGKNGMRKQALPSALGAVAALSPKTYGNGGNGGYFDGYNVAYKNPTIGSNGYAKITYDSRAQGASGGGGGGGAFVVVKSIPVSSSAQMPVQVGAGGVGAPSFDGKDGGDTVMSIYAAYGGKGGKKGVVETDTTAAKQGVGGEGGKVYPETLETNVKYDSASGKTGEDAKTSSDGLYSTGGNGGVSGIFVSSKIIDLSNKIACGGFVNNNCVSSFAGLDIPGGSFVEFKKPSALYSKNGDYGSAGSGGGGGGWKYDGVKSFVGAGAKGQDGYLYVWW